MKQRTRGRCSRGQAIIEMTLMMPWIIFLFVGVLDFGFYSYALIATQNGARVGAMAGSFGGGAPNAVSTCNAVVAEMNSLPGTQSYVPGTYTCLYDTAPTTTNRIAISTPTTEAETDGSTAAVVTVSYLPPVMIPIPGVMNTPPIVTRIAKAPLLSSAPGG
jgi:hypothetical protein